MAKTTNTGVEVHEALALTHEIIGLMNEFHATDSIKLAALENAKNIVATQSLFTRRLTEHHRPT